MSKTSGLESLNKLILEQYISHLISQLFILFENNGSKKFLCKFHTLITQYLFLRKDILNNIRAIVEIEHLELGQRIEWVFNNVSCLQSQLNI